MLTTGLVYWAPEDGHTRVTSVASTWQYNIMCHFAFGARSTTGGAGITFELCDCVTTVYVIEQWNIPPFRQPRQARDDAPNM